MSEYERQSSDEETQLRVLVANERPDKLAALTQLLAGLGHVVVAGSVEVEKSAPPHGANIPTLPSWR